MKNFEKRVSKRSLELKNLVKSYRGGVNCSNIRVGETKKRFKFQFSPKFISGLGQ